MSANFIVVPWFDSTEWKKAYNLIYSENRNKQEALNLLQTWKARSPSLPSGIESTLCLLQVHVQDIQAGVDTTQEHVLRLAYSSAIMRFVNHMLDAETAKGISLYQAAKTLGVPDWIIDLRHDTAHNNSLPTLSLLRNACLTSIQWLQQNYWDKHQEYIEDYKYGSEREDSDEANISALINFLSCLGICKQAKINRVRDIPDGEMQESIVNDARVLLDNIEDFSNLRNVSISSLLNQLEANMSKYLKSKNTNALFYKSVLGTDSLFLSLELVDLMSKNDFHNKQTLSRKYVKCFEPLLTILHTHDLILELVVELVDITKNDDRPSSLLAALWISEILKGLNTSKQFLERARKMKSVSAMSNEKKDLKLLFHHWFPNEKNSFIMNLQKPVPSKLTDIDFIKPIISCYNPYLNYFIHDLLVWLEPHLPKTVGTKICKLAKLISAPDKFPVRLDPAKIYTVEDVKEENEIIFENDENIGIEVLDKEDCFNNFKGIWKIASKNHSWATTPIGLVPWQMSHTPLEIQ